MSKKRRREQVTAQSQNVEIFEDLAHDDAEIRLKAAEKLLSSISEDKSPSRSDVETILNRLIRGLCSSRKAARFGYAIALTELLVQLWGPDATQGTQLELSIPDILTLIEKQTEISANAPSAVREWNERLLLFMHDVLMMLYRKSKTIALVAFLPKKQSSNQPSCSRVKRMTRNGNECWMSSFPWRRGSLGCESFADGLFTKPWTLFRDSQRRNDMSERL